MNTIPSSTSGHPARNGFSLIEVVLSIGIVSFALLLIIGLIPVGLGSIKHAQEQAAAAECIRQITQAVQYPINTGSGGVFKYQASGVWGGYMPTWSGTGTGNAGEVEVASTGSNAAGPAGSFPDVDISLGGIPSTTTLDKRLKAHITIQSPLVSTTNVTFYPEAQATL